MRVMAWSIAALVLASAACSDDDEDTNIPPATTSDRVVAQTDIVSDQAGAVAMDPELVNAWGLAFNPAGAAWVAATETGLTAVYDANGNHFIPSVTIPAPASATPPSAPTGQVFNGDANAFEGDEFILVTENGTVAGWQESDGSEAVERVDNSADEAIYKGVTIAMDSAGQPRLFAADFHNAKIDVFDAAYAPVSTTGDFSDTDMPDDFAPFNVDEVGGMLIVTYAKQDEDAEDDVRGAGNGFVNLFDTDGNKMARLISAGELNSPWGVTLTPSSFGAAPNQLLIGNFGDGRIHVYTLTLPTTTTLASVTLQGALRNSNGQDVVIDGLWALEFATNIPGFAADQLYFTAGPDDEAHGVFGRMQTTTLSGQAGAGGTTGTGGSGGIPPVGGSAGYSGSPVGM